MEQSNTGTPPTSPTIPSPAIADRDAARCHWCGYALRGLPSHGICPECGNAYDPVSASRLRPRPSAFAICLRLGWPVIGLGIVMAMMSMVRTDETAFAMAIAGYLLLLALPFNSYFQVRSMLKRHMPEGKRTQGPVAVMRTIGTVVCVLIALAVLAPAIAMGACLVAWQVSGSGF